MKSSSTHRLSPITPDYIRVGSRFCLVSWPRLALASVLLFLAALFFGPSSTAAPPAGSGLSGDSPLAAPVQQQETTGSVLRRAAKAVVGRLQTLAAGGSGNGSAGGSKRAAAKAALGLMRPWCRVQTPALPPLGASQAWRPAALGTSPWPTASQGAALCDWAEKTTTQVSFRVCTFPREKDTQVSAYIHKEGHWSGWKKGLAEEFLPLLDSAAAWRAVEGRTLVLDIGANLGFYTLLAATRGYDVLAFEPSALCVERLLLSLDANGVQVASSAKDSTAQVAPFSLLEARQQAAWDAAAAAATAAAGAGGGGDASKRSGSGAAGLAASLVQRRAKEAEKLGRRAGLAAAAAAQAGGGKKLSKGSAAAAVGEEEEEEEEEEEGSGRRRKAAAWVFQNAASDTYATLPFSFMEENPGASFVQWAETKKEGLVDVGAGEWQPAGSSSSTPAAWPHSPPPFSLSLTHTHTHMHPPPPPLLASQWSLTTCSRQALVSQACQCPPRLCPALSPPVCASSR
jgi:hypothetical protein